MRLKALLLGRGALNGRISARETVLAVIEDFRNWIRCPLPAKRRPAIARPFWAISSADGRRFNLG